MIGHCVEIFGTDQAMQALGGFRACMGRGYGLRSEYLNEGVVQQEHDGSRIPSNLGIPEEVLADVTDITDFRMAQAKSPN